MRELYPCGGVRSRPLIDPLLAKPKAVLFRRFLAIKDMTLDAFDFYNRAEAAYTKSLWKFLTATKADHSIFSFCRQDKK